MCDEENRKTRYRCKVLRNQDVKRLLVGIPTKHHHIRMLIELSSGEKLVFQEATLAAMTRAFLNVLLHPEKTLIELSLEKLSNHKKGYSDWQLTETGIEVMSRDDFDAETTSDRP
ncbi:MAG: hypothetical protein ACTSVM_00005 [Candidatus Ranarchaeia archaeon]